VPVTIELRETTRDGALDPEGEILLRLRLAS
jgi:hypothetical protein